MTERNLLRALETSLRLAMLAPDGGKEPHRDKEGFPWFWKWDERVDDFLGGKEFDGARWNDLLYSLKAKKEARARKGVVAR
jgi:hypothetical protein